MKKLVFNEKMRLKFKDFSICEKTNGLERIKNSEVVLIDERNLNFIVEEFSSFLVGFNLYPIGSFSYSWSVLPPSVRVGRYASIGPNLRFYFNSHDTEKITTSSILYDKNFKIFLNAREKFNKDFELASPLVMPITEIGSDSWIGSDVTIKAGVKIGNGSIIGTKSLVTKDVPPFSIVGGNPAKIIRYRFDEDIIKRINNISIYDYNLMDLLPHTTVDSCYLDAVENMIYSLKVNKFKPRSFMIKDLFDLMD